MNLYFRFIWLIIRSFFAKALTHWQSRPQQELLAPCYTRFWVNPLDLDVNFHMNNGRYLSLMDLGRTDLMIRAGVFGRIFFQGYYPVVVSESIRFKRSLDPFQCFEMKTHIEAWTEKDFYLRQSFIHQGQVVAEGYLKARFLKRGRKGSVPTKEIFDVLSLNLPLENMNACSEALNQIEKHLAAKQS